MPLKKQTLEKTRALAVETLHLLLSSKCTSQPQYDPEMDMPATELIEVLVSTDKLLRDLDQQLMNLIGSGDPENGSLAGWISYQSRTGFLPDPTDIIDDREFIESCLTKVKNKILMAMESLPSSPSTPGEGTVAEGLDLLPSSPDYPPLTVPGEVVSR